MTIKQLMSKLKRYPEDLNVMVIDANNPLEQELDFVVTKTPPSDLSWESKHNGAIPADGKTVYIEYFGS